MIELPRDLVRRFRAVLRHSLMTLEPRGSWPLLLIRSDPNGLTMQSCQGNLAVQCRQPDAAGNGSIAFRSSLVSQFEGKAGIVNLEQTGFGKGIARWTAEGAQTVEFETVTIDSVPPFPALPKQLTPMPDNFLQAMTEAAQTTARDIARYAMARLQLRGKRGQIVATDGKQLLVQSGFAFPWTEDVLVPRVPAFGLRELASEEPVELGSTAKHVTIRAGCWTFALEIDPANGYPDVNAVIPRSSTNTSRFRIDPGDAALLLDRLPKLPGRNDDHSPITLDMASQAVVRAQDSGQGQVTEVALIRSTVSGPPVYLCLDRRFLMRALQMGFMELQVNGPSNPVLCRDQQRLYLYMPLDKESAIPPDKNTVRLDSAQSETPSPPTPERRKAAMPAQSKGCSPENGRPETVQADRLGIEEIITEAEVIKVQLQEASARMARLLAALKQQRRQSKAVQAAVASLRQLHIDH